MLFDKDIEFDGIYHHRVVSAIWFYDVTCGIRYTYFGLAV